MIDFLGELAAALWLDIKTLLLDPRVFNYVILTLYFLNAARWAYEGKIADVCYWLSAAAITATVTFLYNH